MQGYFPLRLTCPVGCIIAPDDLVRPKGSASDVRIPCPYYYLATSVFGLDPDQGQRSNDSVSG
jgi:hypothetical protein